MFEENNYYIKFVNNKKTTFEEAEAILESKYKSSLENKKQALGLRLDLVEIEKQIPYISKSLSISMLDGKFLLEVSDEDDEEYENYFYINPNAPIALTYYPDYPDLIDNNLHKVPLSMFTEDKEFVCEVIKDFFDKGNTEKINEMKLLIEPEIEEIFDWKCKNKFPYNYVKFGKKGLIPEAKIDRIYKKITK